ncbi:SpoIVB peptidase [Clostridium neonatale]|uniref:SpoIVB peptidase n=1 Tax=Clostridium neonatale TaxID=137838 RepID=UPI003D34D081
MKKNLNRIIGFIITLILILILVPTVTVINLPDKIYTNNISVSSLAPLGNTIAKDENGDNKYEIKLLGMIPLKSIEVQKVDNLKVSLGGIPIGVRVSSDGVIVVGYSEIEINNNKEESPGKLGGLEIGDIILKINDIEVYNATDLLKIIKESDNGLLKMDILRHNQNLTKTIQCKKEDDEDYKIGLWVRDSTAGVGTMTFYDPLSSKFGALGHPITDCDTNEPFLIKKGDILDSSIISVRKGEKGSPGELRGVFVNEDNPCGNIEKNTQSGIYGKIENNNTLNQKCTLIPVGFKNEITIGKAKIVTTIDENGPQEYDIEIEKLMDQNAPDSKSMVIKITDEKLLRKTGGIVQGMSGSPIIQNGKLIGAVTHVLVNKPDTGYGIYIEWMLQDAGIIK